MMVIIILSLVVANMISGDSYKSQVKNNKEIPAVIPSQLSLGVYKK